MNYREARQVDPSADRPDAGKWRWTCMNDGRVWADGACGDGCPGHDTPAEACEHERQRRIAQVAIEPLDAETARYEPGRCQLCMNVATHRAHRPHQHWVVCDDHATREAVASLVHVSQEIASW